MPLLPIDQIRELKTANNLITLHYNGLVFLQFEVILKFDVLKIMTSLVLLRSVFVSKLQHFSNKNFLHRNCVPFGAISMLVRLSNDQIQGKHWPNFNSLSGKIYYHLTPIILTSCILFLFRCMLFATEGKKKKRFFINFYFISSVSTIYCNEFYLSISIINFDKFFKFITIDWYP